MIRLALFTALCVSIAMPVAAQSNMDKTCEEFGAASQQIAELRLSGKSEVEAQLAFVENNAASPLLGMQLVPVVSSYVYGLTDEQLAGDVETPFVEQCKAG